MNKPFTARKKLSFFAILCSCFFAQAWAMENEVRTLTEQEQKEIFEQLEEHAQQEELLNHLINTVKKETKPADLIHLVTFAAENLDAMTSLAEANLLITRKKYWEINKTINNTIKNYTGKTYPEISMTDIPERNHFRLYQILLTEILIPLSSYLIIQNEIENLEKNKTKRDELNTFIKEKIGPSLDDYKTETRLLYEFIITAFDTGKNSDLFSKKSPIPKTMQNLNPIQNLLASLAYSIYERFKIKNVDTFETLKKIFEEIYTSTKKKS